MATNLNEQQVRSIALFFLYALVDERAAMQAADRVIAFLKSRSPQDDIDPVSRVRLVQICRAQLEKARKQASRHKSSIDFSSGWSLPNHTEISPWVRFQKAAPPEVLLAFLFSKILSCSDAEIAEGLGVSEGTVRYRIGKAVRHLGASTRLSA